MNKAQYPTERKSTHLELTLIENGLPHKILIDYATHKRMLDEDVKIVLYKDNRSESFFIRIYKINKKYVSLSFSKWILNAANKECVTFKNSNTMDFLLDNLSLTDRIGVSQNRTGSQKNSKSKIRGVSFDIERNKWVAAVYFNGKRAFFKRYDDIESAEENAIRVRLELMDHSFSDM